MKHWLLAALLWTLPLWGQPHFNHVVLIVQENRTVDNLFGGTSIPGADIVPMGTAQSLNYPAGDIPHTHAAYLKEYVQHVYPAAANNFVGASYVQPYVDLAVQNGFANRMFQTNQGPSFPAHQFLFRGTSAPQVTGPYSGYFVAENQIGTSTCINTYSVGGIGKVLLIAPDGTETVKFSTCLDGPTLSDELDGAGLTWKYYGINSYLWLAPSAVSHLCQANAKGKICTGAEYNANVVPNPPQFLTDVANGTLANVSWITPAASYSDHPGDGTGGPAWVSSIVNAIGQSSYWGDTAIVVVWDDWGGWYDHVQPPPGYPGCESYCYGGRVPMVVISALTPVNYVSNAQMDFGSILQFVEGNWGLGPVDPAYADAYALPFDPGFFSGLPKVFIPVKSRRLTIGELESEGEPDND